MTDATESPRAQIAPPSKHQLAFMIWLCVFPTLTFINFAFGGWLQRCHRCFGHSCSQQLRYRS